MKIKDKIKKKIKEGGLKFCLLFPFSISFVMTFLCYFYWNARYTFEFGDDVIRYSSALKDLCTKTDYAADEVLAINVSYDRVLIPYYESRLPQGNIDITDRYKLFVFLDSLSCWNNYRYIACDVRFDSIYSTEWDNDLFELIAGMRDITVARGTGNSYPSILADKVSNSSYSEFLSGDGFLKFSYKSQDGMDNMAYHMWKELDGGSIKEHWWGYSSSGKPCVCSFIPDLRYVTRSYDLSGTDNPNNLNELEVYNLGEDILSQFYEDQDIAELFKDKIILIGDFKESDIHDTIKNRLSGPAIIYNEYLGLKAGDHIVRLWVLAVLFLVFGLEISYAFKAYWWKKDKKNDKKQQGCVCAILRAVWNAIATWIGYTGVLGIVCFILYAKSGMFVNAIIIGSIIAFMSSFIKSPEV